MSGACASMVRIAGRSAATAGARQANRMLVLVLLALATGCAGTRGDEVPTFEARPTAAAVLAEERSDPVTHSGRPAAVLSLHRRTALTNGCRYGLTLTNRLSYPIERIYFRYAALGFDYRELAEVPGSFSDVEPGAGQYREIFFHLPCREIYSVEVVDPGHCTLGELRGPTAQPGECLAHVEIVPSPQVEFLKR